MCCYSEDETEASSPGSLAEQQGSVAHPGHHMEAGGWYQVYLHYIYIISTLYLHCTLYLQYIYIISTAYLGRWGQWSGQDEAAGADEEDGE